MAARSPHLLAVDDGPFEKRQRGPVPLVAVMMEGAAPGPDGTRGVVEGVALSSLPVDPDDATGHLIGWIRGLRCHPSLQAVVLGGITIAGLGVVDIEALAHAIGRPVLVANRRDPLASRLTRALRAAGLAERIEIVERSPAAERVDEGLYLSWAGTTRAEAHALLSSCRGKGQLPEPLRIAHLIARALVKGESRGRA